MARAETVLLGGPFDGATIAQRPDEFVFVGGDPAERLRGFLRDSPNRTLYRRHGDSFLCAEHTHVVCPDCGGFTVRRRVCEFCSASLVA